MRETTTLARRSPTDERAEEILASALKGKGGALTRADAVALTGLSTDQTDQALKSLLRRYKSHLSATDEGELIYRFDPDMARRDAVTLGERLAQLGQILWKGFTFLFKIWIVFTLIFYVTAFVAMMIALIFARSSSDRDDDRGGGGFGINPWILWWLMPDWAPADYQRRRQLQPFSGRQRKIAPSKRFYQSVFDYVFGPAGPPKDALAGEKEVVAYLREHDGLVTATDLVALTGWGFDHAEQEATRLLASYDGEAEIAEDGTLVYSFPDLRRTTGELLTTQSWRSAWQKERTPEPLTGNTSGANTAISVMNGFNLVAALTVGPLFLAKFGIAEPLIQTLVTAVPLAFSTTFFAVPGIRTLRRSRQMRRLADENARAQTIAAILGRRGAATTPEALVADVVQRGVEPDVARAMLEKLLIDLEGDVKTDDGGKTLYAFPRITEELVAVETARQLAAPTEREAGQVVFTSEGDGDGGDDDHTDGLPATEPTRRLPT